MQTLYIFFYIFEDNDDPLEEDEKPEYLRTPKSVDFSKIDLNNPEAILAASKMGKPVMMFVTVCCELLEWIFV